VAATLVLRSARGSALAGPSDYFAEPERNFFAGQQQQQEPAAQMAPPSGLARLWNLSIFWLWPSLDPLQICFAHSTVAAPSFKPDNNSRHVAG